MASRVALGEAAVVLHPVRDIDGDPVTGQAGTIATSLFDPTGASSALSVTVAEIGVTGWYTLTVTPTSVGLWRLQATGDSPLGRAVPNAPSAAFVDYALDVAAAGVATGVSLLTTRARVKERLGLTDATFDALVDTIVGEVSADIQDRIGHQVLEATFTDYLDGSGRDILELRNGPLVSVASVDSVAYTDAGGGSRAESLTSVDQYRRLEGGLRVEGHLGRGWVQLVGGDAFTEGRRNYRVAYTAGFALVPETLAHAATIAAVREFNTRELHGLRNKSVGDSSVDPVAPASADQALERAIRPYVTWSVG